MLKLIRKIKFDYSILKNIFSLANKKIKFIFYSENKFYQKYSSPIIELLAKKYPKQIYYVSSDLNDKIENTNVKNLFIGDGLLMKVFFAIIKAEYFFLTVTDLDNHYLKKNKNVNNYIYYFHVAGSTFKGYTKGAFDNYDIILCNGQFQIEEIRFRENRKNIKKKKLILTGYFYFDHILKKTNLNQNANEILVAPSWSYKYKNFINKNCIEIINELLKKGYNVSFRPHPEHFKRSFETLKNIKDKFNSYKTFRFDDNSESIKSMEKAKCLITDTSGIYLEYMLILNRPVLFLDGIDKIHNEDYGDYKNFIPIEQKFKNEFGTIFSENEIKNIDLLVENSIKNFNSKIPQLNNLKNNSFFNFGKTIERFETILENQILGRD
jgi:YidC/Oxa1 family membrane protein insertase